MFEGKDMDPQGGAASVRKLMDERRISNLQTLFSFRYPQFSLFPTFVSSDVGYSHFLLGRRQKGPLVSFFH